MNHQPFENWLLQDETLLPDEEQVLQAHLAGCSNCQELESTWKGVAHRLKHAQMAAPADGFSERWKQRLALEQQRRQRRQSLAVLVLSLGAAGILALVMINLVYPLWRVPGLVFWTTIYQLFTLSQWFNLLGDLGAELLNFSGQELSLAPLWILFIVGLACELGVLWLISLRRLVNPKKVRMD